MGISKNKLSPQEKEGLLAVLKTRFEKHMSRHKDISWDKVQAKLEANPDKLWALNEMEETGGEPDLVALASEKSSEFVFIDCAAESPKGRRSICYDHEALESRKEHKPANSAVNMAIEMGIELLTVEQYKELQQFGHFDAKTSSWVVTPVDIREKGGAIFGDYRFGTIFIYHNGAESYYAARGFRGMLRV